jgi:hypothetical protein
VDPTKKEDWVVDIFIKQMLDWEVSAMPILVLLSIIAKEKQKQQRNRMA